MKPVSFVGSSRDDLREFPSDVRRMIGLELMRLQLGGTPGDFKPLRQVGLGAYEIRVQLGGAWRVIYVAKFESAIYVLHAFQKKSRRTAQLDINLAARRYRLIGGAR